jgi:alkylated DNA repair protein (DNA oxidative demethylase)
MGRMRGVVERPEGLLYQPALLDENEDVALRADLERLELREVRMHGQVAKRTVYHYGYDYGYESWTLTSGEPIPGWMQDLRARCAALAGVEASSLAQVLVTKYPPGASIGWHRDAPVFGPSLVGVSLLSACRMRFQRRVRDTRYVYELDLEPRSAYVLAGAARRLWQHSIPPVPSLRYSLTFRTLRTGALGTRPV